MSKKRGFTLTEVLVVIALTTLIMTMIGTAFVFVGTSSGNLINKSEQLTQTQSIETYLRSLIAKETNINDLITNYTELDKIKLDDKGNLVVNGKIEFKDTGLTSFRIYRDTKDNKFVRCELKYGEDAIYDFILGLWRE